LAVSVQASDALILIRHDRAGPNLPSQDFKHPNWILWPAVQLPGSDNGLLSIGTGQDWEGQPADLEFQSVGPREWKSINWDSLNQRGYFATRQSFLNADEPQLLASPRGTVDSTSLLVSLGNNPTTKAIDFKSANASQGWLVYDARSWDEVAYLSHQIGGRALVIEYPPSQGTLWTRFWEFGAGWPSADLSPQDPNLKVPGLVPISRVHDLLRHPDTLRWIGNHVTVWGGPNRWLARGVDVSPLVSALLLTAAFITGALGLLAIRQERKDSLVRVALFAVLLFPAADELAMNVAYGTGLSGWPALLLASELILVGAAVGISSMIRFKAPDASWSIGVFAMGALVTTFLNPIWSDFSPSLRWPPESISPELIGAWTGYLAGLFGVMDGLSVAWRRTSFIVLVALLAPSILGMAWWAGLRNLGAIFPAVAWLAGVGLCRGWFLPALAVLCLPFKALSFGLTWQPYHLIPSIADKDGLNTADWVRFLLSPSFLISVFATLGTLLLADRFVWYRLKHALAAEPRMTAPLWSGAALTAMGVGNPELLPGALVLCVGGGLSLISEMV
jgi:hypothetical protein